MLVVSAGMQKSGSAYLYNLVNDLMTHAEQGIDARWVKADRQLPHLMKWHNNNIEDLNLFKLLYLWSISVRDGDFAVKTHSGPTLSLRLMEILGMVRTVYCFRDPRDVLLSAIDHGKQILADGQNHTFAGIVDFDKALASVQEWLITWKQYNELPAVLKIRYEDLIADPVSTLESIEKYIGIAVEDGTRQDILWKYSRANKGGERKGMHFNKAEIYRYKTEMEKQQMEKCNAVFGDYIGAMGYET